MSPSENKAVFLSYASQDAEAAQRICEALRASGVEVWFDQNELVGGDAWDQKIRRQIKECAIFVPVISANTQARPEGYFRLEWLLAVERSRLMSDDHPFLFPVVIDETTDAAARVPERFRDVQWTRLNIKDTPESLAARVARVLGRSKLELERPRPGERDEGIAPAKKPAAPWIVRAAVIFGLLIALAVVLRVWWTSRPGETNRPAPAGPAGALGSAPKSEPAANPTEQAITRAYAMFEKMSYTRSNLAAAEDLLKKLTDQASDSARAWGARAYVESCFILRGWDSSQPRCEATQESANHALALDANETEAMLALAILLHQQHAFAQSEVMARRALALRPADSRLRRILGAAVSGAGRNDEALAIRQENVRLFPREPLIYYDLALLLRAQGNFSGAIANFEKAIALQPFASALLQKTMLVAAFRGDLVEARATLDQLEPEDRTEDRAVYVAEWLAVLEHRPDRVIEASNLTARTYFDDLIARGAKASWVALAYQLDGKSALARQQWEAAELALRQRVNGPAATGSDRALWAVTLARLAHTEEAMREIAGFEAAAREQGGPAAATPPQVSLALFYAALGDAPKAVAYARAALNQAHYITDYTLALDPQWDKVRGSPEFSALLAEAQARMAAAKSDGAKATDASGAKSAAEFPRDPDLKRVYHLLYNVVDGIAEDFALMDDLVKPLLAARPNDAEVVTVAAELAQEFVTRGFDSSPSRRAQAQRLTERAAQLAPDNPEALAALGYYLSTSKTQLGRAEDLLRRAIALKPDEPRFHCFLYRVLAASNKPAEEIDAFGARMAKAFPSYPMAPYVIASHYTAINDLPSAETWFDKTLALAPVPVAITSKAQIMLEVHGDVEGMKQWLDRMPERQRTNARLLNTYAVLATVTGDTKQARRLLDSIADTWLADGGYLFPKAQLVGELDQIDGNVDIARLQFEAALKEVRSKLAADPTDLRPVRAELWIQLGLGHREEARTALRLNLQRRPKPYRWSMNLTWWTSALRAGLLLDERAEAMALLREACVEPTGRLLLRNLFHVDPKMAPFRNDPDIVALLAEPGKDPLE